MKTSERLTQISLVGLIMTSAISTDIKAQALTGILKESMVSARDTISTRQEVKSIEVLNASLQSLSDKARRDRRIGGCVLIGLGIGSGIGGVATLAFGDGDDARIVGYSLLGGAAIFSGLSLLPFKIPSESERIYREFSRMPADTPDQVHQKFYYGDHRFEELAQKKRIERIISGSSSVLIGVISLILVDESRQARLHVFIWPAFGGVVRLLVKSDEERRYETYRRAKEDLIVHTSGSGIRFGLAPIPTGGMFGTVQVWF